MAISSTLQGSSQEKQEKASVFKRKLVHKKPRTSSECRPIKKVRFAALPEENRSIVCYEGSALDRANDIQARLPSNLPSFVKQMSKSHISGGFWLGLPRSFCVNHLPKNDDVPDIPGVAVYLEDESGQTHKTKYLVEKNGLSGGWRKFSLDHDLADGDVLVFQLIKRCLLKVYICRGNGPADLDGASELLKLDPQPKPLSIVAPIKEEDEDEESSEMDASDNTSDDSLSVSDVFDKSSPEVMEEASPISNPVGEFKDVKTLEDFKIVVDGIEIDSLIPTNIRTKYYNLCTAQNDFLHRHFDAIANSKLAAGIIMEIVSISDAIRAATITTPLEHLEIWDKTLKAFEDAGMALGFLREHIAKLSALHSEQTEMMQTKMKKRVELEEERKYLHAKIANTKCEMDRLDGEIKAFQVKYSAAELSFMEMANAPW